ncbi:DUF4388 domain-containing protein [Myxococcota bacterium]|nr:DUF4388 domain-containing protein [Myxococcota bacterium]
MADSSAPSDGGLFSVSDYLQLAHLGQRSVVVAIDAGPSLRGQIVVRDGEAWSASDTFGEGEAAFRRLVIGASFERRAPARVLPLGPVLGPKNLDHPLEVLLLETARVFDEGAQPGRSEGPARDLRDFDAPLRRDTRDDDLAADHFTAFVEEGIDALLRKDYAEAWAAFSAAARLRPTDTLVRTNLSRLRDLGWGGTGEKR